MFSIQPPTCKHVMGITVSWMQTLVYHVNKLLWMFRQSKPNTDKVRAAALFRCGKSFSSAFSASQQTSRLSEAARKTSHKPKKHAPPHLDKRSNVLPSQGGDPVTQWHTSSLKSHVSCSAVHIPSQTPQHTDSHVSGRELKQLVMGVCVRSTIPPPLFSHQSSPTLPLTPSPSPFPSVSGSLWDWEQECRVVLLLLVCLNGSGMTLRRASNLHKNSNPPLTKTDPAYFSHLYSRAPPTSHTFPTELRPPTGYYCQPLLLE